MTLTVEVAMAGVRIPLARRRVVAIATQVLRAERVGDARISIVFVRNRAIASLNRVHLGHRGATDVICFALSGGGSRSFVAADIYIAPGVTRDNARRYGSGLREELARLVVHGVLHGVGWDHPDGAARTVSPMWRRQERLVGRVIGEGGR